MKTFTSVPDVAAPLLMGLPVRRLMTNRFDSLARIGQCGLPVFVASGTNDHLIPYRHGLELYKAANGPKTFYPIAGSDHDDPLTPEFFAALRAFMNAQP